MSFAPWSASMKSLARHDELVRTNGKACAAGISSALSSARLPRRSECLSRVIPCCLAEHDTWRCRGAAFGLKAREAAMRTCAILIFTRTN